MNSVFVDSTIGDDARREGLYAGQLFVYTPVPSAVALVELARELIADAFGARDPELAQHEMPVEDYAALLAVLKPKFIHHPRAKEAIRGILRELRCDLTKTYFDVPRMRTATSENYLTSGIAYAFHPHRDTWYCAALPDQLVAADFRHPAVQRDGLPSTVLESTGAQRIPPVQLRRGEPHEPAGGRQAHQDRHARPAQAGRALGARPADPALATGEWDHPVLRGAAAFHRAE